MPDSFDYSKLTDAQLQALAGGQPAAPAPAPGGYDYSKLSEADLAKIGAPAGAQPALAGITGTPPPEAPPKPTIAPRSGAEALVRGALQGASFGFSDELASYPAALIGSDQGTTFDAPTYGERRQQALEYFRAKNRGAQQEYPKTYFGGQLAGGLAAPGASIAKAGQLSNAARIALLARSGAVSGGLAGAGYAEGGAGDTLGNAATGAVLGAAFTPAADTLVRAAAAPVASASGALRRAAGNALSRVAGGIQRDVTPAGGPERFVQAGLEGYERGLIKPWDFFPGAAARQEERVGQLATQSTGEITQALDAVGAKVPAAPLKQALQDASDGLRQFPTANAGPLARVDGLIDDLGKHADGQGNISARVLQSAKSTIDDLISSWDPTRRSSLAQGLNKALYRTIARAQEDAVEASGSLPARAAYQAAKRSSSLAQVLEGFQESAQRRSANQLSSVGGLQGTIGGLMGAATGGNIFSALAGNAGTRAITSPRTAALVALAASRTARLAPQYAQSALNPLIARSAAQAIVGSLNEPKGALR